MDTRSVAHPGHYPRLEVDQESPHGCYDGWVYLGFEGEDENGEDIERVRCRRCNAGGADHLGGL